MHVQKVDDGPITWRLVPVVGVDAGWEAEALARLAGDADPETTLRRVQYRWYSGVYAAIDNEFETCGGLTPERLRQVLADTADRYPGHRQILDDFAGHPALVAGERHHRQRILETTGVDLALVALPPVDRSPAGTGLDAEWSAGRRSWYEIGAGLFCARRRERAQAAA